MRCENVRYHSFIILLVSCAIFAGCQKEFNCPDCAVNKYPIADAGQDTTLSLPLLRITLTGSASTDPDGTIVSYHWEKIAGPDSLQIINDTLANTSAEKIKAGVYIFELTVTDNSGFTDKDSVKIVVLDPLQTLHPPEARAGADTIIHSLNSAILLNGSFSSDPDNNIASFEWNQISTHPVATISNPDYSITLVTFNGTGNYTFVLKVTDSTGLSDTDTLRVSILGIADNFCSGISRTNIIAKTTSIGKLSVPRRLGSAAAAGNKIVFAGGYPDYDDNPLSRVDIYNIDSKTWSQSSLSSPRVSMATVVLNNRIYFAGGTNYELDFARGSTYSTVDIYDAFSDGWSTRNLSEARMGMAGTTLNNKLFFGGGASVFAGQSSQSNKMSDRVDIYSPDTDHWDTDRLLQARYDLKADVADSKIFFAGGSTGALLFSPVVDLFSPGSSLWFTRDMKIPRSGFNSISFDNKIMWVGGYTTRGATVETTAQIEIFDSRNGTSTIHCLAAPTAWYLNHNGIARWKNWIVIFPDMVYNPRIFEIYNIANNTWHIGILDRDIYWPSVVVAGDQLFVADGALGNVWNIDF